MDHKLRRKLVDLARIKGAKISFQALSDEFHLGLDMKTKKDRLMMSRLLAEISTYEHNEGRPLLGAITETKGKKGRHTDEFYKLCEELGMGAWEELKENPQFLIDQRNACYDYWREDENYKEHRYIYDYI